MPDYNIWKANFGLVAATGGGSIGGAAAAVPEPATAMLAMLLALVAPWGRSIRKSTTC